MTESVAQKKTIILGSSLLRFYRRHGWSAEILESCLLMGKLKFFDDPPFEAQDGTMIDMSYWVAGAGARFDVKRLLTHTGEVRDGQNRIVPVEGHEKFLTENNW